MLKSCHVYFNLKIWFSVTYELIQLMLQDVAHLQWLPAPAWHFPVPWVMVKAVSLLGASVKCSQNFGWGICGIYKESMQRPLCLCVSQSHFHIIYSMCLCYGLHNCQVIKYLEKKKAGHCSCCFSSYVSYPSRSIRQRDIWVEVFSQHSSLPRTWEYDLI